MFTETFCLFKVSLNVLTSAVRLVTLFSHCCNDDSVELVGGGPSVGQQSLEISASLPAISI